MIIAFTGYAQSGKDTAAKALIEDGWHRRAFADPIKDKARRENVFVNAMVSEWGWDITKTLFPTVRKTMQTVGVRERDKDPDYWVRIAMADLPDRVVITDCRFLNEVEAVKAAGGIVVRVERPGVGPVNDHISDTGIDALPVDYVIYNDGTVADLHDRVRKVAMSYA